MGCDIHISTEEFNTIDNVKEWRNTDHYKRNYYYTPGKEDGEKEFDVVEAYRGRDYNLFAALADVRNYGHTEPMSAPRGIPEDAHEITKNHMQKYGDDGHSHSYCTLQELYEYQAAYGTTTDSGLITPEQAKELDEKGINPTSWCEGSSIKNLVWREWTNNGSPVDYLIKSLERRFSYFGYKLSKEKAEKCRIVFFFDN